MWATGEFESNLKNLGLEAVLNTPLMQRLKGISFLSTMEYIYNNVDKGYSRYDHSIGAANSTVRLAETLELSRFQTTVLAIAYLLHDTSHTPFSHAAEAFLLERKRKYHEGLLTLYFRKRLPDILAGFPPEIKSAVQLLLTNQPTGDPLIDSLFYCPVNCDKIDGTNRTLFALKQEFLMPAELTRVFCRQGENIWVRPEHLSVLTRFWHLKKHLYENFIYTQKVFAAEAMLTRILEMVYADPAQANVFFTETDREARDKIYQNELAGWIFDGFSRDKFFQPLSRIRPDLYEDFKDKCRNVRFNKGKRQILEREIAGILHVEPVFVISHFGFTKKFKDGRMPDTTPVNISDLGKIFGSARESGSLFDIFIPQGDF